MEAIPGTLGAVLYAGKAKSLALESEWVRLVRAVAQGDRQALHTLYARAHRPVFTLILRITGSRQAAEALTLDVFHRVWRRAAGYDAEESTVLGWIMNQARSRVIAHLRAEGPAQSDSGDIAELKRQRLALRSALNILSPLERQAIEVAFFSELSYAEAAARLNQPVAAVTASIRSGLHKLRRALGAGASQP